MWLQACFWFGLSFVSLPSLFDFVCVCVHVIDDTISNDVSIMLFRMSSRYLFIEEVIKHY
jgi:hypothetical protein